MAEPEVKSFRARLEHNQSRLNWVIIRIPFDVSQVWGGRGMLKVRGEINGFAFRTSLFPNGKGGHTLLVNKRMQVGAKATLGGVADFRLQPDTAERTVPVAIELKVALAEDRRLARWFDRLNYSTRKYIADWITEVKSRDARERRAEQIAERLLATMEAEQELPPVLQVEFLRNPLAKTGWERMSETRRRAHLLGIFYYRTPDARARRIAKMLQEGELLAANQANQAKTKTKTKAKTRTTATKTTKTKPKSKSKSKTTTDSEMGRGSLLRTVKSSLPPTRSVGTGSGDLSPGRPPASSARYNTYQILFLHPPVGKVLP
jgi:uncharacterized protein YdeI (YjbR/CyaY-like superfamily)